MFKKFCLLAVAGICLTGCQKILDYYNYRGSEPAPHCKLLSITNRSGNDSVTTIFSYYSDGSPSGYQHIVYDAQFETSYDYAFQYLYDGQGRLIAETSDWVYSEPQVSYVYEGGSRLPVRDTVTSPVAGIVTVEDLEYDDRGRVIKITRRVIENWFGDEIPPTEVFRYYYDIRGNRQEHPSNPGYAGLIAYTDNPGLLSLHPAWQLIHKNWSRNSGPAAETFNEQGLPLSIKPKAAHVDNFLHLWYSSVLQYECE